MQLPCAQEPKALNDVPVAGMRHGGAYGDEDDDDEAAAAGPSQPCKGRGMHPHTITFGVVSIVIASHNIK